MQYEDVSYINAALLRFMYTIFRFKFSTTVIMKLTGAYSRHDFDDLKSRTGYLTVITNPLVERYRVNCVIIKVVSRPNMLVVTAQA